MAKKKSTKISELIPDSKNFNKHSEHGMRLLEKSVEKFGILEAVTVSADNVIISGNARSEVIGNKIDNDAVVIESDGTKPVIIRRTDIKSGTKQFHEAALAANAVPKENIILDAEVIEAELGEAVCEEWGVKHNTSEGKSVQLDSEGFIVEVKCESEREQEKLFKELESKGYECRLLTL